MKNNLTPLQIRILKLLQDGPKTSTELAELLGESEVAIESALGKLRD